MDKIRIDKWLWAVRVHKTRSIATSACNSGKIRIKGNTVKPSRNIKPGDIISVRKRYIIYTYKVLGLIDKRISAKLSIRYVKDITPEKEKGKEIINLSIPNYKREKGSGRPTKKDRRSLEKTRSKLGY